MGTVRTMNSNDKGDAGKTVRLERVPNRYSVVGGPTPVTARLVRVTGGLVIAAVPGCAAPVRLYASTGLQVAANTDGAHYRIAK